MNNVYTTKTLGKELRKKQRTLCKGQAKSRKLMFMANHTIVDWGPHGIWLSNCSDDITTLYMII